MNINIRYIVMLCAISLMSQAIFAAKLDIENATGDRVTVKMFYGHTNREFKEANIPSGQTWDNVSSGIHNFVGIRWTELSSGRCYSHPTPSSRTMLNGSIKLGLNGRISFNFDGNGVFYENKETLNLIDTTAAMCKTRE